MYAQVTAMNATITNLQDAMSKGHAALQKSIDKNYDDFDKRLTRIENDVYTTRFSRAKGSEITPQPNAIP